MKTLTLAELASHERTLIERFYRQPISEDLIREDNRGKFRRAIRLFEALFGVYADSDWKHRKSMDLHFRGWDVMKARGAEAALIQRALESAELFVDGQLRSERVFSKADLVPFVDFVREHKAQIEAQLEMAIRADLRTKPLQVLGRFLKLIGLRVVKDRTSRRKSAKKTYFYRLNSQALKRAREVAKQRTDSHDGWDYVHELHGLGETPWQRHRRVTDEAIKEWEARKLLAKEMGAN